MKTIIGALLAITCIAALAHWVGEYAEMRANRLEQEGAGVSADRPVVQPPAAKRDYVQSKDLYRSISDFGKRWWWVVPLFAALIFGVEKREEARSRRIMETILKRRKEVRSEEPAPPT